MRLKQSTLIWRREVCDPDSGGSFSMLIGGGVSVRALYWITQLSVCILRLWMQLGRGGMKITDDKRESSLVQGRGRGTHSAMVRPELITFTAGWIHKDRFGWEGTWQIQARGETLKTTTKMLWWQEVFRSWMQVTNGHNWNIDVWDYRWVLTKKKSFSSASDLFTLRHSLL